MAARPPASPGTARAAHPGRGGVQRTAVTRGAAALTATGTAVRRVARGRGGARGPARDPVGRALGVRRMAPQHDRQAPLVRRDPPVGLGGLLGPDRHGDRGPAGSARGAASSSTSAGSCASCCPRRRRGADDVPWRRTGARARAARHRGAPAMPLLATQIRWINLLTGSALALALGGDPVAPEGSAPPNERLARLPANVIVVASTWRLPLPASASHGCQPASMSANRKLPNAARLSSGPKASRIRLATEPLSRCSERGLVSCDSAAIRPNRGVHARRGDESRRFRPSRRCPHNRRAGAGLPRSRDRRPAAPRGLGDLIPRFLRHGRGRW
jgi:hypothetical protein